MANTARTLLVLMVVSAVVLAQRAEVEDICLLPPLQPTDNGCEAYIPLFTYSAARGRCENFIYGGCGGTENLFPSLGECEKRCADRSKAPVRPLTPAEVAARCSEPPRKGACQAGPKRFAFSPESGKCRRLPLGACDNENDNKFESLIDCLWICKPNSRPGRSVQ